MTSHIFQIAVCDDDLNDLKETEQSTSEICFEENICACFVSYENSLALLNDLKEGKKFDLLLLDVLMPDLNSMELARCLRESKQNTSIIFISVNLEMALQGYQVSAPRHLVKPLKKDELRETILFCHKQTASLFLL